MRALVIDLMVLAIVALAGCGETSQNASDLTRGIIVECSEDVVGTYFDNYKCIKVEDSIYSWSYDR